LRRNSGIASTLKNSSEEMAIKKQGAGTRFSGSIVGLSRGFKKKAHISVWSARVLRTIKRGFSGFDFRGDL